ncbi:MAG TPA: peptidylprolyl isomerase [Bryobacteraceae bacterium]|nr:peptidylprolyl isomerase [Bryobacteraceae bacterium]
MPLLLLALLAGLLGAQTPPATPPLGPGLYAIITTSMGTITAELFEHQAPNTVRNFVGLAVGGRPWLDAKTRKMVTRPLYQNLLFHRVIPEFMIQTGDPTATGAASCGFNIPDEYSPYLKFDRPGRLAMANTGEPNSGACQFFITETPFPAGNGKYPIFGQVVDGQNVVPKISHVVRDSHDKPLFPVRLIGIKVIRVIPKVNLETPASKGQGLFVNPGGDILTTWETINGCAEVHLADGTKLQEGPSDHQNNLALLHSPKKPESTAAFSEEDSFKIGNTEVKDGAAMGFLEASGVKYEKGTAGDAGKYTVEIQCFK